MGFEATCDHIGELRDVSLASSRFGQGRRNTSPGGAPSTKEETVSRVDDIAIVLDQQLDRVGLVLSSQESCDFIVNPETTLSGAYSAGQPTYQCNYVWG